MERKAVIGIVVTLLAVSILMTVLPVGASSHTVLSVQPTSIVDQTLVPGSIFHVNITVANVQDLWGYQFSLWYDPTILICGRVELYVELSTVSTFSGVRLGEVDNELDYIVLIEHGYYGAWSGFSTVDAVPMVGIDFTVVGVGTTQLHFDPWWTQLADCLGNTIKSPWNLVILDGYFDNRGPVEFTQVLIETVETWNLPAGTENTLTSKLSAAIGLLNLGNENGAIHKLNDFIKNVEALRGKKLTNEQADYLLSEAQRIMGLISG